MGEHNRGFGGPRNMQMTQQPQQITIPVGKTGGVVCTHCGSMLFAPGYMLRTISGIISPTGKEEMSALQVFYCVGCGEVNTHGMAEDMKAIVRKARLQSLDLSGGNVSGDIGG